jgi:dual specificity phosphatase 12
MIEIEPGIFLGNLHNSSDRSLLEENHIKGMVSLGNGRWDFWPTLTRDYVPENCHKFVPCLDSSTQDLLIHMEDICDFIDHVFLSHLKESSPGAILVHCDQGVSRSATVVIAYLMRKRGQKFEEILVMVKENRNIKPSVTFTEQLQIWEQVGYKI